MPTGFDFGTLSTHVKTNKDVLVSQTISGGKTASMLLKHGHILTGVKTEDSIGTIEGDVVLQDGDGCGFTPDGQTKISTRPMKVKAIKVNEEYCLKDLNKYYTQLWQQEAGLGSDPEKMPGMLEEKFVDLKINAIEKKNDKLMWQGDTALTGDANLKWIDGFYKILDSTVGAKAVNAKKGIGTITVGTGAATVVGVGTSFTGQVSVGDKLYNNAGTLIGTVLTVTDDTHITLAANGAVAVTGGAFRITPAAVTSPIAAGTGITPANVVAVMNSVYAGIPEDVLDNSDVNPVYIWVGYDVARMHLQALSDSDLYQYKVTGKELKEGYFLPGTNVQVIPVTGASGSGRIVAMTLENMWGGTDLENEYEEFKMWFSDDDDKLKFKSDYKLGVQIAFPSEVAHWMAL